MCTNRFPIPLLAVVCATLTAGPAVATAAPSITSCSATRQGNLVHVEAIADAAATWAGTQLLIDADGDAKTGYGGATAGRGYDVMVEGSAVYRFKGADPAAWTWDRVGTATRTVDGTKLTIDVDAGLVKGDSPAAAVLLRAMSAAYQPVASATAIVDLSGGKTASNSTATPPAAAPAAALSASASQDGTDLVLKVTAAKPADLTTVLVFFDTDGNADTGFNPPADPHFGFELMIQGGSLSRHTGAARDGWSWLALAPVKQAVAGSAEELRFNASLLKSTRVRVGVWQMSPDWQARTAFFPAAPGGGAGTLEVNLDATKLRADATVTDVPMAPVHADAALPPRERFRRAQSYTCYYGPDRVAALSHVDAAILHTPAQTPGTVGQLNRLGVVTIGYESVGEDETLRTGNGRGPGGKASWYFDRSHTGAPEKNGIWSSYFADAADPLWRADRVAEAKRLCGTGPGQGGFQGIFLDTVETVDAYPESRAGMIQLIGELRAAVPDDVIVINRGFSLLKEPAVSAKIDGLMFESFTDSYDFDAKRYVRFQPQDLDATRGVMVSTVLPAVQQYGLRVLALDYCEPDQHDRMAEAADRAVTFGMVPGASDIGLDAVYDTWDLTPHPDPRFLEKLSTPEALQVTMDAARNGFPAGTVVRPTSCFMGYSVAAVVDGIRDRGGLAWSKQSWASAEDPSASQALTLELPTPVTGGTLHVTFATDGGRPHPSRAFDVAVRADASGAWDTVAAPRGQADVAYSCPLPAGPVRQIRITQARGGGSADRPDLMWVAQVERTE